MSDIPGDDGELEIRISADHQYGIVRIAFAGPVIWLGMEPEHAREFAARILAKADELDAKR